MKLSFVSALLLSGLALAGCATGPTDGAAGSAQETVVVTAADTRALTGSQRLEEDLSAGAVYEFDASKGPIDFARIDLVTPGNQVLPMESVVQSMAQTEGVDAATFAAKTFSVSGDSLADDGEAPSAAPQQAAQCTFFVRYQTADGAWHTIAFPC